MSIWRILPDGNVYRSFHIVGLSPSEVLDINAMFRSGRAVRGAWTPMRVELWEYEGEERKPLGDFPGLAIIPLSISARALKLLHPLVKDNTETLNLITEPPLGKFYALNIFFADCLDHSRSVLVRYTDGEIMDVDKYAFRPNCLEGKHIFRLPEVWTYVFVDDVFKQAVEQNGLEGLVFYKVPMVDET
ncbi:MAG: hypothetical protein N2559_18220 [Anaerolineae bacterium]|nr:hypothetical protein [Anaerolineae bacterium]